MKDIKQRKARTFESFKTASDVFEVLKTQFATRKLYVKYAQDKTEITINEYLDDKTIMVVTDPTYEHDGRIIVYGLSDKYIEVDLQVLEERGPGYYHCKVRSARRATAGRRDLRFKIAAEEAYATNFRISKHTIDLTSFKIPTSIKVLLDQYGNSNSQKADIVKVDVFSTNETDPVLNAVKKTGKTFLVEDAASPESYVPMTDDFIDPNEVYGDSLDMVIKKNVEKGYTSILVVPIIYITEDESSMPFGYIHMISKSESFGLEKVLELKDDSFRLVDRIRDANTMMVNVHQQIIDISRGGAKLKISDPNLIRSFMKSKGFVFDIVFKLQAPITIYGDIKVTYTDESGNMFIGVDFEGNSSRKDEMKRFYAILKPMEVEYKTRLIKSMKSR